MFLFVFLLLETIKLYLKWLILLKFKTLMVMLGLNLQILVILFLIIQQEDQQLDFEGTKAAFEAAQAADMGAIVSARSGETEDVTIVHLATGWGAHQLKVGSFTRSERMAKWNEGLRVGDALGSLALPAKSVFPWG